MAAGTPDAPEERLLAPFRWTRRRWLKLAGVGGLFALGGGWAYRTVRRYGPPAPGRHCFDADEYPIVERIAETFFPGPPEGPLSAAQAKVAEFVDRHVAGFYPDTALLFRTLVRALNLAPVLPYGRSFYWLPPRRRRQVLDDWANSRFVVRRSGYQSLRFVFAMGYFENDEVRRAVGLGLGCPGVEGRMGR